MRAIYVDGSFADGTDLGTSDLDLTVVFKDAFENDSERDVATILGSESECCAQIELDASPVDEATLRREGMPPMLKLASRLVWGEDIRDRFPIMPIAAWTRDRMHAAYWLTNKLYGRPAPARLPLDYPDADDEFFGYLRRTVRLPDRGDVPSTRDLIRSTGWAATALLAYRKGVYVARKRDCHVLYRKHISDEWSDLLSAVYDECRMRWGYLIPHDKEERARLRAICARTLAFENHVMSEYRRFLLSELRSDDAEARAQAAKVQGMLPMRDDEVEQATAMGSPSPT